MTIKALIDHSLNGAAHDAKNTLETILQQKVADIIACKKKEVAQNLVGQKEDNENI